MKSLNAQLASCTYRAQSTYLEKQLGGTALFFSGLIGKVSPFGAQVSLLDPVAFTLSLRNIVGYPIHER